MNRRPTADPAGPPAHRARPAATLEGRRPRRPLVGLDSFSYHRHLGETLRWEQDLDVRWSTTDVLDRATEHGAEAVSLQSCYLALDPTTGAGRRGVEVLARGVRERGLRALLAWGHRDGLRGGTSPERLAEALAWIAVASAFDLPLVRIVAGCTAEWSQPPVERIERLVPQLRMLASVAADHGVGLALENHADFGMRHVVELVERVASPDLGICLDLGNLPRVGDEVVAMTALAVPHVRMVHVKDIRIDPASEGDPDGWWPTTPLGAGDLGADGSLDAALVATLAAPDLVGWFVEMAAMHPDEPDEDRAVAHGLEVLRRRRDGLPITARRGRPSDAGVGGGSVDA